MIIAKCFSCLWFKFQIAPVINPADGSHVHHMLIYECDSLDDSYIGYSASCYSAGGRAVSQCLQGTLIAAWAVGGEVCVYVCVCVYACVCVLMDCLFSVSLCRNLFTLLMWLIPLVDLVPPATLSCRLTMTTPIDAQVPYMLKLLKSAKFNVLSLLNNHAHRHCGQLWYEVLLYQHRKEI